MRSADEWFELYGESHQNKTNKAIHFIFVPLIMFTVIGLFLSIPMPESMTNISPHLNAATIFIAVTWLGFYLRTNALLALGMLIQVALMYLLQFLILQALNGSLGWLAIINVAVFAVSWVFQFVGHKIEGKKPSFINDLQFLLIGPMWILGFIYRNLGIKY